MSNKVVKKEKVIKAYAVLGYPDNNPMPFGSLAKNFKGALSIFENKEDAEKMAGATHGSWKMRPCKITYTV